MRTRVELAQRLLDHAYQVVVDNVAIVTLEEAICAPPGGYRSILGTHKHTAGWSHVYCSYAFDADPKHWEYVDWPRGLRETIDLSQDYLDEIIAWFGLAHRRWMESLRGLASHHLNHAGEINQLLSISRREAWEETEEVEENHISTVGHRVRPPWLE